MTVYPFTTRQFRAFLDVVRRSATDNDGKFRGPLARLTDFLGLDFLDDEWKRALFFGFLIALIGFVITLLGNLIQKSDLETLEREALDKLDVMDTETLEKGDVAADGVISTEGNDEALSLEESAADDTQQQPQQKRDRENEGTEEPVSKSDEPKTASSSVADSFMPLIRKFTPSKRKANEAVEGAVADAVNDPAKNAVAEA